MRLPRIPDVAAMAAAWRAVWRGRMLPRTRALVEILCPLCGRTIARYEQTERFVVDGRRYPVPPEIRCPDHGELALPWKRFETAFHEARRTGRCKHIRAVTLD